MKHNPFKSLTISVLMATMLLGLDVANASEGREAYANVEVRVPEGYRMTQMQTFSGAVPSRAWIFERDGKEVFVSVMNTDGILDGLHGQDPVVLARLYLEGLVTGWGGELEKNEEGTESVTEEILACGAESGVRTQATFGGKSFDYYLCFLRSPRHDRMSAVAVWDVHGTPEPETTGRLSTFLGQIRFAEKTGME